MDTILDKAFAIVHIISTQEKAAVVFTKYSTDTDFHPPYPAFSVSCSHLQISADGTAHPPSPAFPWLFALSSDSIPNPQKC